MGAGSAFNVVGSIWSAMGKGYGIEARDPTMDEADPEDGTVWAWELPDNLGTAPKACAVRLSLPYHLRNLARVEGEVCLEVPPPVTIAAVLDALEARFPVLRGTIRDDGTLKRRPFIRFFACKEDLSLGPVDSRLPEAVLDGTEPFLVVGAMAGG